MDQVTTDEPRPQGHEEAGEVAHAHAHHLAAHAPAERGAARRLAVALGVATCIMLVEAVGGWLSGSLALLSDAGHMMTDVAALGLAVLAVHFGSRPADLKRTFGFRRLEVLAAQFNVATLFAITGWIAWEAIDRLRTPHHGIDLGVMAGAAVLGIVGNAVILVWLRHDHGVNTRSAFLHVMGDAVASLGVLCGAVAMWLRPDLAWIDPVLSLAIAALILWGAMRLVLEISDNGTGKGASADGTGLSIVRALVRDELRGELALEDDGGLRVIVSFPT